MTSLLFITEVLSLQSEAVSFTKGFMWAGVIKALLDLHCLFRVIWRSTTDVSADDNQQQSSETELENPEANESNKFLVEYLWVGIVHEVKGDPHSLSSDCTLVVWRIAEKMLGIECWSILWLQWANLTTVLPTNSTWAWEVLYLKQYKMCFANITAEKPYHSLQTFHLLDIMNVLCPLAYNLPLKFCVCGWGGQERHLWWEIINIIMLQAKRTIFITHAFCPFSLLVSHFE